MNTIISLIFTYILAIFVTGVLSTLAGGFSEINHIFVAFTAVLVIHLTITWFRELPNSSGSGILVCCAGTLMPVILLNADANKYITAASIDFIDILALFAIWFSALCGLSAFVLKRKNTKAPWKCNKYVDEIATGSSIAKSISIWTIAFIPLLLGSGFFTTTIATLSLVLMVVTFVASSYTYVHTRPYSVFNSIVEININEMASNNLMVTGFSNPITSAVAIFLFVVSFTYAFAELTVATIFVSIATTAIVTGLAYGERVYRRATVSEFTQSQFYVG